MNVGLIGGQIKEKWPVKVLKGDLAPGFDIALAIKDLPLACLAAQSAGVSLSMESLAHSLFQLAQHVWKDVQDTSSMTDHLAEVNGQVPIRL